MTTLSELRELAESATPGPWQATTNEATMNDRSQYRFGPTNRPAVFFGHQMRSADAAYVEAASPAATLDLLDRIRAVEALHASDHPGEEDAQCVGCLEVDPGAWAPWPCPTIRAVRGGS